MMQGWNVVVDPRKVGRNLLIVDGLNLSFRYKHKGQTEFATDYLKTVNSFAKSYSCEDKIVLSDFKGSTYRKELYPEYKGNRDYSDQTEAEKAQVEEFFAGFNRALDLIEKSDCHLIKHRGIEADDFAAYIVMALEDYYDNIWLISTDRDWDELLSTKVHRFSYNNRKEFFLQKFNVETEELEDGQFFEDHGCDDPHQYVAMKCLQGDLSDGIRGVEGIGVKRAYSIVRNYDSLLDLVDALPLEGNQKFIQNLNAAEDILIRNMELMDLKTFSPEIIASTSMEALELVDSLVRTLQGDSEEYAEL